MPLPDKVFTLRRHQRQHDGEKVCVVTDHHLSTRLLLLVEQSVGLDDSNFEMGFNVPLVGVETIGLAVEGSPSTPKNAAEVIVGFLLTG